MSKKLDYSKKSWIKTFLRLDEHDKIVLALSPSLGNHYEKPNDEICTVLEKFVCMIPGHIPDGQFPDGHFPDGHIPGGRFPDGYFPDGHFPDQTHPRLGQFPDIHYTFIIKREFNLGNS